jgi:hypothetical protein
MYAKLPLPSWLELGGDLRGAGGYLQTPERYLVGIPMQADVYASAVWNAFRAYVTVGYRPSIYEGGVSTFQPPWSREHYVMWESNPGGTEGLYVRVGRFMPVFGLRVAEHDEYIRRYGGTQLYAETYGAAVEYVSAQWEGHVTAFIKDPLIDTVEHSNGAAAYGEYRIDPATAVGLEGMAAVSDDDRKLRAGVTAKRYFECPKILLQGEGQVVDLIIPHGNTDGTATYSYQLVGELLASWFPTQAFMVDAGIGYYNEDLRLHGPYRDAFDFNIHWFTSSHFETILMSRYELLEGSPSSEPTGSYVMLMGHYRL